MGSVILDGAVIGLLLLEALSVAWAGRMLDWKEAQHIVRYDYFLILLASH